MAKEDVVGAVVTPSIVNKPWLRTTAVLGTLLLASYYFQKPLPGQFVKLAHLFGFASWFGTSMWVLLLSPKIMFTNLGRQTFGKLQAKLFPQYFGFSALTLVVLLGTKPFSGWPYTLSLALLCTVFNWLVLEPIISKSAAERYALENAEKRDEDKIKALMKTTSKYHGMSSSVALVTVCCAVAHGYLLSTTLSF